MNSNKKSAFHYAWVVLISTVIMNFFYSIVFSSFGVYAASVLEANPEISRTAYSIIPTLHSLFSTIFLLSYGKIVQKISFRGVILGGGLSIAIGYFIYSFASNQVSPKPWLTVSLTLKLTAPSISSVNIFSICSRSDLSASIISSS